MAAKIISSLNPFYPTALSSAMSSSIYCLLCVNCATEALLCLHIHTLGVDITILPSIPWAPLSIFGSLSCLSSSPFSYLVLDL